MQTAQRESGRHARRLEELQREQQKLLHLFYKGSVAEEVLVAEQDRIEAERTEARRWAEQPPTTRARSSKTSERR
jgi:hypothetical protein